MKKYILLLPLVILDIYGLSQQKNDWANYELKGKVKSVREVSYEGIKKGRKIIKGEKSNCGSLGSEDLFLAFNENGYLLETIFFNSSNEIRTRETVQRDSTGKKIQSFFQDRGKTYTLEHQYNGRNEEIQQVSTDSSGNQISVLTFKYDESGNQIYSKYISFSDTTKFRIITSEYDENDKEISFTFNGFRKFKVKTEYDGEGYQISSEMYSLTDSLESREIYKNDLHGNKIESTMYYYPKGNIMYHQRFQYKYDVFGNWIQKITIEDRIPPCIVEREIVYFE